MTLPAMILAAGFGTRMGALTRDRPKPLIAVAGRPLIDHALRVARSAGAAPIAVNGHYRAGQLADHLAGCGDVRFLHETPQILDSAGGVRNALPVLGDGAIVTLNADTVWTGANPIDTLAAAWDSDIMGGLLLLIPQARATGRLGAGDFALAADGRITSDSAGHVYTGAQILGPGVIGGYPPGPRGMWQVWTDLAAGNRLFGCLHPGGWADVGHPGGIAAAERLLETGDV